MIRQNYQKNISQDYILYYNQSFGKGAHTQVFKGYSKTRQSIVAIKQYIGKPQNIYSKYPNLNRQFQIMKKFNHINILKLFDYIISSQAIYVIFQYCDDGDLRQLLNKKKLTQYQIFHIFSQIVAGMCQVNNKNCFHRDLKPQNILLTKNRIVKIGDFGLARQLIDNSISKALVYTAKGTPIYAAPNVVNGDEFSGLCDVWSAGIMLDEMLKGKHMFSEIKNMFKLYNEQKELISKQFKLQGRFNNFFKEILKRMIRNEDSRISFKQINEIIQKRRGIIQKELKQEDELKNKQNQVDHRQQNIEQYGGQQKQSKKNMIIKIKKKKQDIYENIVSMFDYVGLLFNYACLFTQAIKMLNDCPKYPLPNIIKYTLISLKLHLFFQLIEHIQIYLNAKQLIIPHQNTIIKQKLDKKNIQYLQTHINIYLSNLLQQKNKYTKIQNTIYHKLFSSSYKQKHAQIFAKYQFLYSLLSNKQHKYQFDYLIQQYKGIIKAQCLFHHQQHSQNIIRIYYLLLELTSIQTNQLKQSTPFYITKQNIHTLPIEIIKTKIPQISSKL